MIDLVNDETLWEYPEILQLGDLAFDTEHQLVMQIIVPVPCRLTSQIRSLRVPPDDISPGAHSINLRIEPQAKGTQLNGTLCLATTGKERRIRVTGRFVTTPGGRDLTGKGQLVWQAQDWETVTSALAGNLKPFDPNALPNLSKLLNILGIGLSPQQTFFPPPPPVDSSLYPSTTPYPQPTVQPPSFGPSIGGPQPTVSPQRAKTLPPSHPTVKPPNPETSIGRPPPSVSPQPPKTTLHGKIKPLSKVLLALFSTVLVVLAVLAAVKVLVWTDGLPPQSSYTASISPPEQSFSQDVNEISVSFALDHTATRPVTVPFGLGGTAQFEDYELAPPSADNRVHLDQGQKTKILLLRRRRGPRGLGNRFVEIKCQADADVVPDEQHQVCRITIPDPESILAWSVVPPSDVDRDGNRRLSARLRVTLKPPRSDPVTVKYRATAEPNLIIQGPPINTDGTRSITLSTAQPWSQDETSAEQTLEFPSDEQVGGPSTRCRLEIAGIVPGQIKGNLPPLEFVLKATDSQILTGNVLVLVVLTPDLVQNSQIVSEELRKLVELAENENLRGRLVGGSIFLLGGDKNISRLRPGPEGLKNHVPFPIGTDVKDILAATEEKGRELTRRTKRDLESESSFERAVLLSDFAIPGQVDDDTIGKFQGTWSFYLIETTPNPSQLAVALEKMSKRNTDLVTCRRLENQQISGELLKLLRNAR